MNATIFGSVRIGKVILTVLFAGLWLVAASHCAWEQLPVFSFFVCQTTSGPAHSSPASHCADGFCQQVEGGSCLPSQQVSSNLVRAAIELCALLPLVDVSLPEVAGGGGRVETPPELPQTWQFVFRAALPPRATSLVA